MDLYLCIEANLNHSLEQFHLIPTTSLSSLQKLILLILIGISLAMWFK